MGVNVLLGHSEVDLIKEALTDRKDNNLFLMREKEFFEGSLDLAIKEVENVRIDLILNTLKEVTSE